MSKGRELYEAARAEIERRYHESLAALDSAWDVLSQIVPEFDNKTNHGTTTVAASPANAVTPTGISGSQYDSFEKPAVKPSPRKSWKRVNKKNGPRHFSTTIHRILMASAKPLSGSVILTRLKARLKLPANDRSINISGLLGQYVASGTVEAHRDFTPMRYSLTKLGRQKVEATMETVVPRPNNGKSGIVGVVARALPIKAPCTTKEMCAYVRDICGNAKVLPVNASEATSRVSAVFANFRARGWVESETINPTTREQLWSLTSRGLADLPTVYPVPDDKQLTPLLAELDETE